MLDPIARGVTLLELLVALAVLAILVAAGVPGLREFIITQRLKAAAETVYADLTLARDEALHRNRTISIAFEFEEGGTRWCFAPSDHLPCDCQRGECGIGAHSAHGTTEAAFREISLRTNFYHQVVSFHPVRGTANPGTVALTASDQIIEVRVSNLGRIRLCAVELGGYPIC